MTFTSRAAWSDTPEPLRRAVADALGAPIVAHTDLHGGMSPGPAVGLRLGDGRQVFVKAVSAEVRVHNHTMIRQESAILDVLPDSVPAPRRLATVEAGPWIAMATTWAAGATAGLWTDASIEAVARACRTASGHRAPDSLPPVARRIFYFDGWARLAEHHADLQGRAQPGLDGDRHGRAQPGFDADCQGRAQPGLDADCQGRAQPGLDADLHYRAYPGLEADHRGRVGPGLDADRRGGVRQGLGSGDDWEGEHAGRAAEVVAGWEEWTAGDALVHRDIRLDNTAVEGRAGSAVLLDWAYASAGAPWIDLAQLAADVVATGHVGGPEKANEAAYRLLLDLPPEASRFVVGLAGMWSIKAATVADGVMPGIAGWRRARAAALRPLVTRLLA